MNGLHRICGRRGASSEGNPLFGLYSDVERGQEDGVWKLHLTEHRPVYRAAGAEQAGPQGWGKMRGWRIESSNYSTPDARCGKSPSSSRWVFVRFGSGPAPAKRSTPDQCATSPSRFSDLKENGDSPKAQSSTRVFRRSRRMIPG